MPPKKKKSTEGGGSNAAFRVRQLWTAMSPDSWLDFLNATRKDHGFHFKGSGPNRELWGRCPYHSDPNASFHIRFKHGYAKCFGECSTFVSDPIALAAHAMGRPYSDALEHLTTNYGISGIPEDVKGELRAAMAKKELKRDIARILNAELVDAALAGRTDPQFKYAQETVDWLEARNIPLDMLHTLPLGVIPPTSRFWERLKELKAKEKKEISTEAQNYLRDIIPIGPTTIGSYEGWLVFINHTTPSDIGLFRLRKPNTKEIRVVQEGDGTSPMGYFGLGTGLYRTVIGNSENPLAEKVVVVEGEFTALAAIVPQIMSGNLQQVVVSAGGNNNQCLDSLADVGFQEVRILGDRDGGGENFNKSHLKATKLRSKVFRWPSTMLVGSDLHDVWMAVGNDLLINEVVNDANYIFPQDWALACLDNERGRYKTDDVGGLSRLAMNIGSVLNDRAEKDVYVTEAAKLLGFADASLLKKHLASPDTEDGFVAMLQEQLDREYRFLYYDNLTGGGTRVVAWNRTRKKFTHFDLARDSAVAGAFKTDLGSIVDWVATHIGEPMWLKSPADADGNVLEKKLAVRAKEYEAYLSSQALPRMVTSLPGKSALKKLGQGLHYKNGRYYVVNGVAFCRGEPQDDGSIRWSDIDGPVDDEFQVHEPDVKFKWSQLFNNADDLNNLPEVNMPDLMERARQVFEHGWLFDNHALEAQYLASYLFCVGSNAVYDEIPWIFVTAQQMSGKTFLVSNALASNNGYSRICMLECATATDNFTEAGIRKLARDSTLVRALDEFEIGYDPNKGAKQNYAAQEVLNTVRGAQGKGGTRTTMGSASGGGVIDEYTLRFPLVLAGITPLVAKQDISRYNYIYLQHKPDGAATPPDQKILSKFTEEQLLDIRHGTTIFTVRNAERIRKAYRDVLEEFRDGQHFHAQYTSRYQQSLLPIITIMKMAGWDYKKFAETYSARKVERMKESGATQEYEELWSTILHTPGIQVANGDDKDRRFTIAELLSTPRRRHLVNESNCGVYWDDVTSHVVVSWHTVMRSILRGSKFAGYTFAGLKATLQSDRNIIPAPKLQGDVKMKSVFALMNQFGCSIRDVSVVPGHYLINELRTTKPDDDIEAHINRTTTVVDPMRTSLDGGKVAVVRGQKDNI